MMVRASESDVIVIGAGIHGCCTALHFAKRGLQVIVLEKGSIGRQASAVNAGGVRQLMRAFEEIPLSQAAMECWQNLDEILGPRLAKQCEFKGHLGQIGIAVTQREMDWCINRANELQSRGFDFEEVIDQSELRKLIPEVASHSLGGIVSRDDGHANPAKTNYAFKLRAEEFGTVFYQESGVERIDKTQNGWLVATPNGTFKSQLVINCAGAWGGNIAAMMGDPLPNSHFAVSMMVTARVPKFLNPVAVGIEHKLSIKQTDIGTIVIGGGIPAIPDLARSTAEVLAERLVESAETVIEFFPCLKDVPIMRTWAGLEGVTPDDLPIIGKSISADNFWHIYGFSGHGFQLGTIVGQVVCERILDGNSDLSLDAFRPGRFLSDRGSSRFKNAG